MFWHTVLHDVGLNPLYRFYICFVIYSMFLALLLYYISSYMGFHYLM